MASLINELIDTMKSQNEIYTSLLEIASKKKVCIIENDIKTLQGYIKEENILVGKNQKLEKKRIELFDDISIVLGKNKDITLKDIIEKISGQKGEKELIEVRNEMLIVLPKLKTINDQNQELIKLSLDYIDFSMNMIRGANSQPTYFDYLGNEINSLDKKMFDARQ